jgi:hypothetical protein
MILIGLSAAVAFLEIRSIFTSAKFTQCSAWAIRFQLSAGLLPAVCVDGLLRAVLIILKVASDFHHSFGKFCFFFK